MTLRRPVLLFALVATGAIGGATATAAALRSDPPVREVFAQVTNPQGAQGRTLYLQRVTVPAGAKLAAHTHQGTQIANIEQGRLRYTVEAGKPVKVVIPDTSGGAPQFVRLIRAGESFTVGTGYSVIEPAGSAHRTEAVGAKDVVIYVGSLFVAGAPLSDPYPAEQ